MNKEGLLTPKRSSNGYRDYSEEDIEQLKKIIIFRKLGFSLADIKAILTGELSLSNAIAENIKNINQQISELNGALEVCKIMEKDPSAETNFDQEHYWKLIHAKEESGMYFKELVKDYLEYEKKAFISMWAGPFHYNLGDKIKKHGFPIACVILLLICIIRGLAAEFLWETGDFWTGFSYPFILFALVSLISLPIFILNRKYKNFDMPEEKEPKKQALLITICKILLAIAYFVFYFLGVPMITEGLLLDLVMNTNVAYVFNSDMYVIYYIVGLCVMGIFVWLYSKHGIFADISTGTWEEGLKANLPQKEKIKVAAFSIIIFIVTACLPLFWYNCITEKGVQVRCFFAYSTYTWEEVDYYTLDTRYDNTLDFSIVLQNNTKVPLDGIACTMEHLPEDIYPNGTTDFWYYLAQTFKDMGIPLVVQDWDKLEKDLDYDYWREVAGEIRVIGGN